MRVGSAQGCCHQDKYDIISGVWEELMSKEVQTGTANTWVIQWDDLCKVHTLPKMFMLDNSTGFINVSHRISDDCSVRSTY